jgi:hypothetical protein
LRRCTFFFCQVESFMKTKLLLAWPLTLVYFLAAGLVWGQQQPLKVADQTQAVADKEKKPEADKPEAAGEKTPEAPKFIRLRRDDSNKPLAMETAVVRFVSDSRPGVAVDLIGAVHIADKGYYDELNKLFESYEVLLYELVAPEGTTIPKGGRKGGNSHPIGALQDGMGSLLELQHQLSCIDYTKANFVHADMSPEEFSKTMTDRGESFFQMFMRMMGQGMAQNAAGGKGSNDVDLLFALFSRDRATKLKIAMAEQFENLEGQMSVLEDSTIIGQRNRKCFEVLEKQLKDGKKSIGVFYGAGHFPDMEKRLVADFGMKRESEKWLIAWQLGKKPAEQPPAPEKPDAKPGEKVEDKKP